MQKIHPIRNYLWAALASFALANTVTGCHASQATYEMKKHDPMAPCPDRPNCVSSEAQDSRHAVAPMQLAGRSDTEWTDLQALVSQVPRTRIVTATDRYLHVTVKSKFLGFIDDLELMRDPSSGRIAIRSASRSGHYDLGVNRRRVENLRAQLKAAALIR